MTVKSSISLTDDQFAFAKSMVDSGQYASLSAVFQKGVEVLRQQQEDETLERDALRTLVHDRISGATLSADTLDQRIASMMAKKRAALGLDS